MVEDEPLIALEISHRLEQRGLEVIGRARSGAQALALAEHQRPDLVLMDIGLEHPTAGIDAAHELRERFDLPVVFLTANTDRATMELAKRTGPFGYLVKPFQEADLLATVEVALYKHELERELRAAKERAEASLAELRRLQKLIPICAYCRKVRTADSDWQGLEHYITAHLDARFSHGICPSCYDDVVLPDLEAWERQRQVSSSSAEATSQHDAGSNDTSAADEPEPSSDS